MNEFTNIYLRDVRNVERMMYRTIMRDDKMNAEEKQTAMMGVSYMADAIETFMAKGDDEDDD